MTDYTNTNKSTSILMLQMTLEAKSRRVHGTLAIPRVALPHKDPNHRRKIYLPEELARGDGQTLPIYWWHTGYKFDPQTGGLADRGNPLGEMNLTWHPETERLDYEGRISQEAVNRIKKESKGRPVYASMGISHTTPDTYEDYDIPRNIKFFEGSLTLDPGIPEAVASFESVNMIDSEPEITATPNTGSSPGNEVIVTENKKLTKEDEKKQTTETKDDAKTDTNAVDKAVVQTTDKVKTPVVQTQVPVVEPKVDVDKVLPTTVGGANADVRGQVEYGELKASLEALKGQVRKSAPGYDHTTESGHDEGECSECLKAKISTLEGAVPAPVPTGASSDVTEDSLQKAIEALTKWGSDPIRPIGLSVVIPRTFDLPPLGRVGSKEYMQERIKAVESIVDKYNASTEAVTSIKTSTSGAGKGVTAVSPAVVVPNDLIANLRDTVQVRVAIPGTDRVRFQTLKVPAAGALTESTEPSTTTPALTTVDATPTPRGAQVDVSFEGAQKIVGPITDAVVTALRMSALEDEDDRILAELDAVTLDATNQIFGDGVVTDNASITAAMVMDPDRIAEALERVKADGYNPDNYVCVVDPVQFTDLIKNSDIRAAEQFGGSQPIQAGIIPSLYGVEVRTSTNVKTDTSAASLANIRSAYIYKKGVSVGLGVSRESVIETFRDIRVNDVVYKAHWDLIAKTIEPDSIVRINTA